MTREDAVTAAIREFATTYEHVQAEIEALEPRAQFAAATRLRESIGDMESQAAKLRARALDLVRITEGLSLAELARVFKRSRERVTQMVHYAQGVPPRPRKPRVKEETSEPDEATGRPGGEVEP